MDIFGERIFRSGVVILWLRVLQMLPPLIIIPLLIARIGEDGYGLYSIIMAVFLGFDQLDKSLQSGVIKYGAHYLATGDCHSLASLISTSRVLSAMIAVLSGVSFLMFAYNSSLLSGGALLPHNGMLTIAVLIAMNALITPSAAIIQSHQYFQLSISLELVAKVIFLVIVGFFPDILSPTPSGLLGSAISILIVARAAQIPIARRLVPSSRDSSRLPSKEQFYRLFYYGGMASLFSVALILNDSGIRWIMGAIESPSFVAHLSIILLPMAVSNQAVSPFTLPIMPSTSALVATGQSKTLEDMLTRGLRYGAILNSVIFVSAFFLLSTLISIWVGPKYSNLTPYALILLGCSSFSLSTTVAHHMLKGTGKMSPVFWNYLFSYVLIPGTCLAVLVYLKVNPYYAVSISLGFGLIVCGFLNLSTSCRIFTVALAPILRDFYIPLILKVTISCAFFSWCRDAIGGVSPQTHSGLSLCLGLITATLAVFSVIILTLTPHERIAIIHNIQLRLRSLRSRPRAKLDRTKNFTEQR